MKKTWLWSCVPFSLMLFTGAHALNFAMGEVPPPREFCYVLEMAKRGASDYQTTAGIMYAYGVGVETNLECAVKWWSKAAKQGDARAQYNIGNAYLSGYGKRQDSIEACKWFKTSAQQGYMHAQTSLGDCYALGIGTPKNMKEAKKWYEKASMQGDTVAIDALTNYGMNKD